GSVRLLAKIRWSSDQRRAAFRGKAWGQRSSRAISPVKRAAACIEKTRRTLDDKPVQLVRPNSIAESFSQPVEEIENKSFFDLNFLMRALQHSNPPDLQVGS